MVCGAVYKCSVAHVCSRSVRMSKLLFTPPHAWVGTFFYSLFFYLFPFPLQHFLGDVEKLIISLKSINTDCKNKNNNKQFATCQPGYLKKVRFGFTLKCRSVDQWRTKRDTRNSKILTKSNAAASAAATCHMNLKLSR